MTASRVERVISPPDIAKSEIARAPTIEGTIFRRDKLAFNLTSEWERAREFGAHYRDTFIDNAHFYAGETYIEGRAAIFEYNVRGNRLKYPKSDIDALDSFARPISDKTRPSWLIDRDRRDLQVIDRIINDLPYAKPMETVWIAASPAIPDSQTKHDERSRYGYGKHNFLFVHQLQVDPITGEKKLVCRALRNYLSPGGQKKLIERLSGEQMPDDEDLHGYVAKLSVGEMPRGFRVQDSMHISHIHSMGKTIAGDLGDRYWSIDDKEQEGDIEQKELDMMEQLAHCDWWLEDVYSDIMALGDSPDTNSLRAIELKFKGWEKIAKKIASGESIDPALIGYTPKRFGGSDIRTTLDQNDPRLALILASANMLGGIGTCGVGSGFGNIVPGTVDPGAVASIGIHGVMSMWAGIALGAQGGEYKRETSTHYESYQCPGCKKWLSGEKKDDKKSWRAKCDHCGEKLNC